MYGPARLPVGRSAASGGLVIMAAASASNDMREITSVVIREYFFSLCRAESRTGNGGVCHENQRKLSPCALGYFGTIIIAVFVRARGTSPTLSRNCAALCAVLIGESRGFWPALRRKSSRQAGRNIWRRRGFVSVSQETWLLHI